MIDGTVGVVGPFLLHT